MVTNYFNDVIGPVMRGSSSSHCAAAVRIGRIVRHLMGSRVERVLIEFDAKGSLAFTHASQGSDMGLFGGLLRWDAKDPRLLESAAALEKAGWSAKILVALVSRGPWAVGSAALAALHEDAKFETEPIRTFRTDRGGACDLECLERADRSAGVSPRVRWPYRPAPAARTSRPA